MKGRFDETRIDDDHVLGGATYPVLEPKDGRLVTVQAPALNALNEKLRDDYVKDAVGRVERWNRIIQKAVVAFSLKVPHKAFNRRIGPLRRCAHRSGRQRGERGGMERAGRSVAAERRRPSFVASLMGRVAEPGKSRTGSPPARGINNQPVDFAYVRFN